MKTSEMLAGKSRTDSNDQTVDAEIVESTCYGTEIVEESPLKKIAKMACVAGILGTALVVGKVLNIKR